MIRLISNEGAVHSEVANVLDIEREDPIIVRLINNKRWSLCSVVANVLERERERENPIMLRLINNKR